MPSRAVASKSDEEQITSAARQFAADIRENDWKGVCDSFSKKAQAQVATAAAAAGIPDCPTFIERAFSANAGFNNLADVKPDDVKVTKITIKGDTATAEVVPSNDQDPTTYFAYEGGKWKIDGDPEAGQARTEDDDGLRLRLRPAGPQWL